MLYCRSGSSRSGTHLIPRLLQRGPGPVAQSHVSIIMAVQNLRSAPTPPLKVPSPRPMTPSQNKGHTDIDVRISIPGRWRGPMEWPSRASRERDLAGNRTVASAGVRLTQLRLTSSRLLRILPPMAAAFSNAAESILAQITSSVIVAGVMKLWIVGTMGPHPRLLRSCRGCRRSGSLFDCGMSCCGVIIG